MRHVLRQWLGIFVALPALPLLLATNLSLSQPQNTTVSISLSQLTITTGQSSVLTWSSAGATSCQGGGDPFIADWSEGSQPLGGSKTVTQSSAGLYVYALTCTGNGSTASASATLTVTNPGSAPTITEAITSLPADITPMLSVAGIWQPVADQYLRADDNSLVVNYVGNIRLANGREGLIATGWSCCGADTSKPITPINIAVLEQQLDGTLQLATSKYVSDPQTNGAASVLVADFNKDGIQDFFLPAYNESPFLPASSTAYVSKGDGTYTKITIGDQVEAHAATLAYVNGAPTVFTGGYYANQPFPHPNVDVWNGSGFTITPQNGIGSNSSMAVGDFYGDGNYSEVYGDLPYPPGPDYVNGIYLYHLADLLPTGNPVNVGDPYFNNKPEYAQYSSYTDPHGKTHAYRTWLDDFNHDGRLDIVVQGSIWNPQQGALKSVLQMFQNAGNYSFNDLTDALNPQYDKDATESDYVPQVRDIDSSGVNSYLLGGTDPFKLTQPAANYLMVNDGSGNLQVALHETLNRYGEQVVAWLTSMSSFNSYYVSATQPYLRAYQTADGKLNFVAVIWVRKPPQNPTLEQYVIVNIPLRLDLPSLFTKPMVVRDRNGSHLIRTFAGDDTIYSGNNGGFSKVDGGLGINTVVYSGPSQNYSATYNADGTWTIKDNVGKDGTDTLTRIQRLQFTDITVNITTPTVLANISTRLPVGTGDNVLIAGFIVTGNQNKKVIVRAIGPSLSLPGKLADPILELHDASGALLEMNDNWMDSPNKQAIIDSTIPPNDPLESAIVRTVPPGNYTAIERGVNNGTGIGVVEAYDLDTSANSKLANISTRGLVQTGDNVLFAGTIVVGQASQKVIIRALGPSTGVPGAMADPTLELHDGNGALAGSE